MVTTPPNLIYRLLREPMFHFLILGSGIFLAYFAMNDRSEIPTENQLIITESDVSRLAKQFQATWFRQPTEAELTALVENQVREEVLVREAQALGLDQNDAVIRQRLRQKMEFLTEMNAQSIAPDDAVLRAYLSDHDQDYAIDPHVSFEQIYLGTRPTLEQVGTIHAALAAGTPANTLGQPTMLPFSVPSTPQWGVDRKFGAGFFTAIDAKIVGGWQGPVVSSFGQHLVRVADFTPGHAPDFDDVRTQVERDWRAQQTVRLKEASYQALRGRYDIKTPDAKAFLEK